MNNEMIKLPVVALRGTTILPGMVVHFDITRESSRTALDRAMNQSKQVFLIAQKDPGIEKPAFRDLCPVGTIARIRQFTRLSPDSVRILAEGIDRAILCRLEEGEDPEALVEPQTEEGKPDPVLAEAMYRTIAGLFREYLAVGGKIGKELAAQILAATDVSVLIDKISIHVPMQWINRQHILESFTVEERFQVLGSILSNEIQVLQVQKELQGKLKLRVDKNQKEYLLREQLKVIREELGDDTIDKDADLFDEKLKDLSADPEIKERISREIARLRRMNTGSAESNVQRMYLETLFDLPWDRRSVDSQDLKRAWKILDADHYGLKDVKERVMEFLAVRQLTGHGKAPILCLAGPPGTGKTSIARSLARALNKKYVRVCLGGVRDESQIRGHRRTYIGALPGDITDALKQAGVSNPLMLLDEIDKTGSDFKGDVSSALLEVLDPEQNRHFRDHYVDIPQNLSEVLFIATANDRQSIPRPLLDRMEVIEIPGYTENEKLHIAKEHLIPRQLEENGLKKDQLTITDAALKKIINNYTREAGVRSLERTIGRLCRRTARLILEEGKKKVKVTASCLDEFLGKEKYHFLMANKKNEIGIARGLAWTQAGGDTLEIEVAVMPGKGEVILTGQLGEVMKESARTGMSYIRSVAAEYGLDQSFFKEHDFHIHIPEGAVPKDGPSAGITMATAMLSAMAEKPVRSDLAMTGEITLRGRVLAIGGLKEKLLAARYAKLDEVLVPIENRKDVEEMDREITEDLKITYVDSMAEVLESALV